MKFTHRFHIFKDESSEDHFVYVDTLFTVLKRNNQSLKRFNIIRSLKKYPGGVKTIHNKDAVPVLSVLRYCVNQADSSEVCNSIAKDIEQELLFGTTNDTTSYISSSLELYRLIAKTNLIDFKNELDNIEINAVPTLIIEHNTEFTHSQWKKITWFESHFFKTVQEKYSELDYETILSLKYNKYASLLSFKSCSEILLSLSQQVIKDKTLRYKAAEQENGVLLTAELTHVPSVLDFDIQTAFEKNLPNNIENVVSFDTHESSRINCIQCLVVLADGSHQSDFHDLCEIVFHEIKHKHSVYLEKIYIGCKQSIKEFIPNNEEIHHLPRFHIRDAIQTRKICDIHYTWCAGQILTDDSICVPDEKICIACRSTSTLKPLALDTFNILQEWYLETPIESQILLEKFINKGSLNRSNNPGVLFQQKVRKLYGAYDILLNIYNKNFVGILQSTNTNELLIEYKSIKTLFDVTSAAGATTSLRKAEIQLKKDANNDLCYYNTYLKAHNLCYESIGGEQKKAVSLRECHAILMLDNLVRLKYVADPNPGEHRSKQICTLPITLQGLPIDSIVTEQWHQADCDGSFNCVCKQAKQLYKKDIDDVLLRNNKRETDVYNQFFQLMTFGNIALWQKLPDEILGHIDTSGTRSDYSNKHSIRNIADDDKELMQNDSETCTSGVVDDQDPVSIQEDDEAEEDLELENVLTNIEIEQTLPDFEPDVSFNTDDEDSDDVYQLQKSFDIMTVLEDVSIEENSQSTLDILSSFGFKKYIVPPLICRHPPPAVGRDDDITKIKEILDEVLIKMGYEANPSACVNRILCGPDNKIGKCLISLIESDKKYSSFLPEFPLLHLRKSKITILFSAYKDAGLIQILRFMRDEEQDDWAKLISVQHIDIATRHIKRIALSLHLAFVVTVAQTLEPEELECFLHDMEAEEPAKTAGTWGSKFNDFLVTGSSRNATFALHVDIMKHCDHVVGIALAERLGGKDGYDLLLAAVKGSLLFSFVNSAASYAPYCTKLLYYHYSCGTFHQNLKTTLYSTPFKQSNRNFACDTKREMDHQDVLKGFRSGSNVESVTCRMSLIDSLNATRQKDTSTQKSESPDNLGWELSSVDENHIFPTTSLILRRNGLSLEENDIPFNVYTKVPIMLPSAILDINSHDVGKYLLLRYISKEKLFTMTTADIPTAEELHGPKDLINRAKRCKGITIKRTIKSKIQNVRTARQTKEDKRQKQVAKEVRKVDSFASENNACQALLKADSSKPKVMKSIGMQRALKGLLYSAIQLSLNDHASEEFLKFNLTAIPEEVTRSASICTFEFAGMKFKAGNVKSGKGYIHFVQTMLNSILYQTSNVSKVIISEEKYSFTPDELKACTRDQRKSSSSSDVSHLKTSTRYLNDNSFDKDVLTKTEEGKKEISLYLSKNMNRIQLAKDITIIVDSEHHLTTYCSCEGVCKKTCKKVSTPLQFSYADNLLQEELLLQNVKQAKGEAEMAVCDWLVHVQNEVQPGESVVCFVTSGDIDAVCLHLYAVNKFWKKDSDGKYCSPVFVILQKQGGKMDIYNVTALLEIFQNVFEDQLIGIKIAFCLCIGGNDFIPKFHQISHDTVLKLFMANKKYRQNLFLNDGMKFNLCKDVYIDFVKNLYIPKKMKDTAIPYETVRAMSIGKVYDETQRDGYRINDPRRWLPPQSAVDRLADLVQVVLDYVQTIGQHDAQLPNFIACRCITRNDSGEIEYNFGPECHFASLADLPEVQTRTTKRQLDDTPQRGANRKKFLASTPKSKTK